jgi:uncharacterized membrane protein SpoIIM required for sporulation
MINMVLESIISPEGVRKNPKSMFILGLLYSIIATVLAYFIFPSDPSLSIIFLTTLAALPLLIKVLEEEEQEEMDYITTAKDLPLIGKHLDVFLDFLYLFFGFLLCFLLIFTLLPSDLGSLFFSKQAETIQSILGPSGFFSANSGVNMAAYSAEEGLKVIMLNNFKVLLFSLLFSFLYGAGAIFILAWNASVLAVAMGSFIKSKIAELGAVAGASIIAVYFQAGSLSLLRYMVHGIPELSAYFLGAVAGGIISAAVVRSDYKDPKFYDILLDSVDLIALASLLLIIGALLEVSVTPLLMT